MASAHPEIACNKVCPTAETCLDDDGVDLIFAEIGLAPSQHPSRPRANLAAATGVWGSDERTEDLAREFDLTPPGIELDGVDLGVDAARELITG